MPQRKSVELNNIINLIISIRVPEDKKTPKRTNKDNNYKGLQET